jgi:hypothetical protein
MFDFGEPHVHVGDVREHSRAIISSKLTIKSQIRTAYVCGEWHLWVSCCAWSIAVDGRQLAHSESSDERIRRAVYLLNGQAISQVEVNPSNGRSRFGFDLGGELRTWSYDEPDEKPSNQWFLFDPSGFVLTVRADGRFSYDPPDGPTPEVGGWMRLPAVNVDIASSVSER